MDNIIAEAFNKGLRIRKKEWDKPNWIKKHPKGMIGSKGIIYKDITHYGDFFALYSYWEIYPEELNKVKWII